MQSMTKNFVAMDMSLITHWSSAIINEYSTDYLSITYWLLIDFIDVNDKLSGVLYAWVAFHFHLLQCKYKDK